MSGWLKFLLYFFIIVSVLKYYETKLNDDKQIVMVVLLILFLIMVADYMFFKNTEGFAKKSKGVKTDAQKLKKKQNKIKRKKAKIQVLKQDCPNPNGNTCADPDPTKFPGIQSAMCNACTPNPAWNNRNGITGDQKGNGCRNPQDACIPYRVADPNATESSGATVPGAYFEVSACVPIEPVLTEGMKINRCDNPSQYNVSPFYIPSANCPCTSDSQCGTGNVCQSEIVMDPYGPRDINGPVWGREVKSCVLATPPPVSF